MLELISVVLAELCQLLRLTNKISLAIILQIVSFAAARVFKAVFDHADEDDEEKRW